MSHDAEVLLKIVGIIVFIAFFIAWISGDLKWKKDDINDWL